MVMFNLFFVLPIISPWSCTIEARSLKIIFTSAISAYDGFGLDKSIFIISKIKIHNAGEEGEVVVYVSSVQKSF